MAHSFSRGKEVGHKLSEICPYEDVARQNGRWLIYFSSFGVLQSVIGTMTPLSGAAR